MELTIRNITKILEETDIKINKYEENTRRLSDEISKLVKARELDQQDYERQTRELNASWSERMKQSDRDHELEVNSWMIKVRSAEEIEKEVMSRMTTHFSGIKHESIRAELE